MQEWCNAEDLPNNPMQIPKIHTDTCKYKEI